MATWKSTIYNLGPINSNTYNSENNDNKNNKI